MKNVLVLTVLALGLGLSACSKNSSDPLGSTLPSTNDHGSSTYHIVPKGTYKGHSWGDWSGQWWNWALKMPAGANAVEGTAAPETNQTGDVWFLAGNTTGGTVTRSITVPKSKALFIPIINFYGDTTGGYPPLAQLDDIVQSIWDESAPRIESAEIDGNSIANVGTDYFAPVTDVTIHEIPASNIIGDNTYGNQKIKSQAATCGDYLMIDELSVGSHTIHFKGSMSYGYSVDMTYNVTVQ